MIVVTGANGNLGRMVVNFLKERIPVSEIAASVREPEKAADLSAAGIDVRQADFRDRASVVRAFTGADKVLIISTSGASDTVSEHRNAVDAAVEAGVKHIFYTSGTKEKISHIGRVHEQTEKAILETGLNYTILRNNLYADVLVREVIGAVKAGILSIPADDGKMTTVTRADCAAAAAAVLATDGHQNKIYDITGPESLSWNDIAEIASEIAGKEIAFIPALTDPFREGLIAKGMPDSRVDFLLEIYKAYSSGAYDIPSDAVAMLTGKPATPTRDFILRAAREALAPQS
ncbi:MAG TPA: SDR family oxidoreductase [Anaerovoracaceae bacterium]|nr:SDR family oxidoreductase [Anaerovoracaceae bacterium]